MLHKPDMGCISVSHWLYVSPTVWLSGPVLSAVLTYGLSPFAIFYGQVASQRSAFSHGSFQTHTFAR